MIVADENLEQYWIELLRIKGFEVYSIREQQPGISDTAVIQVARQKAAILITEDKDFGELVFAHGIKNVSIIFLRYDQPQYHLVEQKLLEAVTLYHDTALPVFVTVTQKNIRIRKI